tara:strand:+ start:470 stop:1042 length:573 start_codon:yes stop_codon:yes gene_type:complete
MNDLKLLNNGDISVKKKKKTPNKKKTSLSKEYKVFLKRSKTSESKSTDSKPNESKPNHLKVSLNNSKRVKIVKMNKNNHSSNNFVRIINNKDTNKNKNKFTKKSQEKQNKRQSKRKKIHRKITKVKQLSFKCHDNRMNINKLIKETNKKSNAEIKEELKKKGIDIKSDKNKLLKDLYLFTSCNNINVVRE